MMSHQRSTIEGHAPSSPSRSHVHRAHHRTGSGTTSGKLRGAHYRRAAGTSAPTRRIRGPTGGTGATASLECTEAGSHAQRSPRRPRANAHGGGNGSSGGSGGVGSLTSTGTSAGSSVDDVATVRELSCAQVREDTSSDDSSGGGSVPDSPPSPRDTARVTRPAPPNRPYTSVGTVSPRLARRWNVTGAPLTRRRHESSRVHASPQPARQAVTSRQQTGPRGPVRRVATGYRIRTLRGRLLPPTARASRQHSRPSTAASRTAPRGFRATSTTSHRARRPARNQQAAATPGSQPPPHNFLVASGDQPCLQPQPQPSRQGQSTHHRGHPRWQQQASKARPGTAFARASPPRRYTAALPARASSFVPGTHSVLTPEPHPNPSSRNSREATASDRADGLSAWTVSSDPAFAPVAAARVFSVHLQRGCVRRRATQRTVQPYLGADQPACLSAVQAAQQWEAACQPPSGVVYLAVQSHRRSIASSNTNHNHTPAMAARGAPRAMSRKGRAGAGSPEAMGIPPLPAYKELPPLPVYNLNAKVRARCCALVWVCV